jgi:hypothetical protein
MAMEIMLNPYNLYNFYNNQDFMMNKMNKIKINIKLLEYSLLWNLLIQV